jgi:hypothetical protein
MRGGEDKNRSRAYNPFYYEFGFGSSRNQQPESNDQLQVEADSERNRLLIRATDVELKEIRQLLTKLGELPEDERGRQTMRVVPMSPSDLQKLIERIQSTWPSVAPNPLRVAPVEVPAETDEEDEADVKPRRRADSKKPRLEPAASDADDRLPVRGVAVSPESSGVRAALANISTREQASPSEFDTLSAQGAVADPSSQDRLPSDADGRRNTRRGDRPPADQQPPAPISITPGPNGLVIASEDVEALDQLERMISELSPTQRTGSKLFYLRNAFCKDVVDVLKDVFREGDSPRQPNPMFDDMYYYYRFGPGSRDQAKERGRLSKRRQLKFISEPMTNTILVLGADAGQLAEIDRLIKVYDEGVRPDSNSVRTTKQLSFRYTTAREVAEVIKDVFRDLLSPIDKAVAKGGAQQQQQEQSRAMYSTTYIFGGDGEKDNARKFKGLLSMGVDDRSNTLIVSAPRDLMGIINEIADELDRAAGESRGVVEVLNLGAASTAVQQILSGVSKPPVTANNKEPAPEANGEKAAAPKAPAGRTEMFVVPN